MAKSEQSDNSIRCPKCRTYCGELKSGVVEMDCRNRKCKVRFRAEAIQVCRSEVKATEIEIEAPEISHLQPAVEM